MGRKLHYKPGSFYRVCDVSGLIYRAEDTRKAWDNTWRRPESYEARQPQDLVRGVRDDQTVPEPRPLTPDQFINQNPGTPTGKFEVYGDKRDVFGAEFLVQNQTGPAYNLGLNSNNLNPSGTAKVQDLNGTVPAVTPASLNQSLNRGPGAGE